MTETKQRAGFIAVIGAPNAGKSTLVNALVGQKVAIVSAKAQTTRAKLMGIAIHGDVQILLVDTPGIFEPRRRLDRAMVHAAWSGAEDSDLVLLVVDSAEGITAEVERAIAGLEKRRSPLFVALNKVDLVKKERLLGLADQLTRRLGPDQLFMISAAQGDGVPDLKQALAEALPEGPWLYPEDEVSDATDRMVAEFSARRSEMVRRLAAMPGVTCFLPQGAFYAFPDVRQAIQNLLSRDVIDAPTDIAFSEYLLNQADVAVVPGSAFGAEGYIRLSFATSQANLEKALSRIVAALG